MRPGVDGLTVETGEIAPRDALAVGVAEGARPDEFLAALWRKASLALTRPGRGDRVSRYTTVEECDPGPRPAL